MLITPGTAAAPTHPSHHTFGTGYLLEAEGIECFCGHSAAADERRDWRFAPLEAESLDGLAPACVVLAECDPLADEGLACADRMRGAGVSVRLDLVRGVTHDFIKLGRVLDEADAAQAMIAAQLQEAFEPR